MVELNIRFEIECMITSNINNLICLKIKIKTISNFLQVLMEYKNETYKKKILYFVKELRIIIIYVIFKYEDVISMVFTGEIRLFF